MRPRVGVLVPSGNSTVEWEISSAAQGISLHFGRIWMPSDREEDLHRSLDDLGYEARKLSHVRPQVVVMACTGLGMMRGVKGHAEMLSRLEIAAGCPAATAASAVTGQLRSSRVRHLTLVTPYPAWLASAVHGFLEEEGFTIAAEAHLGLEEGMEAVSPEQIADLVRHHDCSQSEAVFVSCTDFPALAVAERLSAELGKPVITSNQAIIRLIMDATTGAKAR